TVQRNGRSGTRRPLAAQQAAKTRRANEALWATKADARSKSGGSWRQAAAKLAASLTISQVIPWTWVNSTLGRGGRIRGVSRRTTVSPSTRTRPTAQALSGLWSAVSKSIATNTPSAGGSGMGRGWLRGGMADPSLRGTRMSAALINRPAGRGQSARDLTGV